MPDENAIKQARDCEQGQHVLYTFLTRVDKLSDSVGALDKRVCAVEDSVEASLDGQKDIADGVRALQGELKVVKAMVTPLHAVWGKVKSGALMVLAAYFLKDVPELLGPIMSLFTR